jgi:hypothetical protein
MVGKYMNQIIKLYNAIANNNEIEDIKDEFYYYLPERFIKILDDNEYKINKILEENENKYKELNDYMNKIWENIHNNNESTKPHYVSFEKILKYIDNSIIKFIKNEDVNDNYILLIPLDKLETLSKSNFYFSLLYLKNYMKKKLILNMLFYFVKVIKI